MTQQPPVTNSHHISHSLHDVESERNDEHNDESPSEQAQEGEGDQVPNHPPKPKCHNPKTHNVIASAYANTNRNNAP